MADDLALATTVAFDGRWDTLVALFDGARVLPAHEREAYLGERTADPHVLRELRELLAAYDSGPGPMERVIEALGSEVPATPPAPSRVGPYEILRELGHGGMGVVYLARRADGLYERLVALKVARTPLPDAALRARFLAERDILAGLAHPNIATLYDAGVTDDGLPYFTMEYVSGVTVDTYCDRRMLDVRGRIRLFLHVCSAVAAAHRALVVHRDLKPTNVLVTDNGDVKLLDFGIAKVLEREAAAEGHHTATAGRMMTPAYASPEQVLGKPVSTAADVYALGLLLYEMLSGRRAHRFESSSLAELARVVAEVDPMPMSPALRRAPDGADGAEVVARARGTTVARLTRALRGDLECIVDRALRKDPDARYPSVAHLAEDLERYLAGRPVVARGRSVTYRASRFVRRHRVAVVAVGLALASLVGYTVMTTRHARDLAIAAERERQDAVRAREVADFVVGLFDAADPNVVQRNGVPVAVMVEQGLAKANALSAQPALQARLLNAIGRVYYNLGRFADASDVATRALALSRQTVGETHPDVARDYRLLGLVTGALGKQREAADLFRAALELRLRPEGSFVEAATDKHHLAYALAQSGRAPEAEPLAAEAVAVFRALSPPHAEELGMSLSTLAFIKRRQGQIREAADLYKEALEVNLAGLGQRHPEVARTRQNLATQLSDLGDYDAAERELREALDVYRAAFGLSHPSIATTLNNLGILEARRRRYPEAVEYARQSFEMREQVLGPTHPSTLLALANFGSNLSSMGRLAQAESTLRDVLGRLGSANTAMGPSRHQTSANLAHVLLRRGKLPEAEALGRQALELALAQRQDPMEEAAVRGTLGTVLLARRQFDEAARILEPAVAIRRERLGPNHERTKALQKVLDDARQRRAPTSRP